MNLTDWLTYAGRWYLSQFSTPGATQLPRNWTSASLDFFHTVLATDNEGVSIGSCFQFSVDSF